MAKLRVPGVANHSCSKCSSHALKWECVYSSPGLTVCIVKLLAELSELVLMSESVIYTQGPQTTRPF